MVASRPVRDLLLCAKHLFVAAAFGQELAAGVKTGEESAHPAIYCLLGFGLTLIQRSLRALQFEGQLQPLLGEISEHRGPRWRVIRERQSLFKMPDEPATFVCLIRHGERGLVIVDI